MISGRAGFGETRGAQKLKDIFFLKQGFVFVFFSNGEILSTLCTDLRRRCGISGGVGDRVRGEREEEKKKQSSG